MAILDAQLTLIGSFSAATNAMVPALITAVGTSDGNTPGFWVADMASLPLGGNQSNLGNGGRPLDVMFYIAQAPTSAGSPTIQFQLVQADNAALTSNVDVLSQKPAYLHTELTAGMRIPLKWGTALTPKRYLGARVVIANAALTNAAGWLMASCGPDLYHPNRILNTSYSIR